MLLIHSNFILLMVFSQNYGLDLPLRKLRRLHFNTKWPIQNDENALKLTLDQSNQVLKTGITINGNTPWSETFTVHGENKSIGILTGGLTYEIWDYIEKYGKLKLDRNSTAFKIRTIGRTDETGTMFAAVRDGDVDIGLGMVNNCCNR